MAKWRLKVKEQKISRMIQKESLRLFQATVACDIQKKDTQMIQMIIESLERLIVLRNQLLAVQVELEDVGGASDTLDELLFLIQSKNDWKSKVA